MKNSVIPYIFHFKVVSMLILIIIIIIYICNNSESKFENLSFCGTQLQELVLSIYQVLFLFDVPVGIFVLVLLNDYN